MATPLDKIKFNSTSLLNLAILIQGTFFFFWFCGKLIVFQQMQFHDAA